MDGNGCSSFLTDQIEVVDPVLVTFILPNDETCEIEDTFALSGGNPIGGIYSGPGVSGTNFDPSAVGPGVTTISYTFLDEFGCTSVITDDVNVSAAATVTSVVTNPPVFCGGTDGFLIVNAIQGSTSPQFRLDGGAWQFSNFFPGLATGDYVLEIRNNDNNCIFPYANNPITCLLYTSPSPRD